MARTYNGSMDVHAVLPEHTQGTPTSGDTSWLGEGRLQHKIQPLSKSSLVICCTTQVPQATIAHFTVQLGI